MIALARGSVGGTTMACERMAILLAQPGGWLACVAIVRAVLCRVVGCCACQSLPLVHVPVTAPCLFACLPGKSTLHCLWSAMHAWKVVSDCARLSLLCMPGHVST